MVKSIWPASAGVVALAFGSTASAEFQVEVSGYLKNETSVFTQSGQVTGGAKSTIDDSNTHSQGDLLKFENSARFFLNGDIGESSSWHADVNLIADTEGVNADYKWPRRFTQYDPLRELYVDTSYGDWDLRLGKQQVVWGTADGIKLLDIINPTDWREFNQNTMEDSRIPIWMINAERNIGDTGNIQFIISQHEESKFAGLNENGDSGHPFIFRGVDTITGQVNGFRSIAPVMGQAALYFDNFARGAGFGGLDADLLGLGFGNYSIGSSRVADYVDGVGAIPGADPVLGRAFANGSCGDAGQAGASGDGANVACLQNIVEGTGTGSTTGFTLAGNEFVTRTINGTWNPTAPSSAFEYMPDAAFGTFNSFVNLKTEYRRDYPDELDPNFGFRYKFYTEGGTNISLNYLYSYDVNPSIEIKYEAPDGTPLNAVVDRDTDPSITGGNVVRLYDDEGNQRCSAMGGAGATGAAVNPVTAAGINVNTTDVDPSTPGGRGCNLVFEETVHRIHNIGASFDTAFAALDQDWVMRGEFLYQKDVRWPTVDRGALAIGHLTEALKMEKTDWFKYVIGLDTNVMTNLFVSAQFIQFINLDHTDEESDWNKDIRSARKRSAGATGGGVVDTNVNYRKYSGDFANLSLTNEMQKSEEFDNYYSLFFSKPFGPQQQHRWNNIFIFEQKGGYWNRFDVEYSFTDDLIGTFEWNHYWGDENSMFGQFAKSSNLQAGIRYLF